MRRAGLVIAFKIVAAGAAAFLVSSTLLHAASPPDYAAVDAIFNQHCVECHGSKDPEGEFVLETFDSLMKGGELGAALVPGKSSESLLIKMVEGRFEKDGKKKIMPPGRREKLNPQEIALLKAWIDAGARAPAGPIARKELAVPKIVPTTSPRVPINSIVSTGNALFVARCGEVAQLSFPDLQPVRALSCVPGNVNALALLPGANQLFAAGGQPGLYGQVCQFNLADGSLVRSLKGHKDAIYALALSPDGKTLATGGYDQKIKLWDVATGREKASLSGHNGCVYHLAFRPDGKILASASADRTVKLWDAVSGERRDTLSQSLKELYTVAFSPDGQRLVAGGADNRIRVWQISENAAETTNPLLESKFAHEGAILALAFSPDGKTLVSSADDRTVKIWDFKQMKEEHLLEPQSDWAPALSFAADQLIVGRLDGTLGVYEMATGKARVASLRLNQETSQVAGTKALAGNLKEKTR